MKIEIGESLACSYLRHVKQCWLVQANWKTSEHWSRERSAAELEAMFNRIRRKFDTDGNVFKQTKDFAQFLKQGEIDIVGVDQKGGIHAMEIAFHEAGLNYGGGVGNRVLKKLLRTLMILHAYHPIDARFSVYFVSPKVNPGVQKPLNDIFDILRAEYPAVEWHLLTNQNFTEQMVRPTLEKSGTVADTTELFVRAAKLLEVTGILPSEEVRQKSGHASTTVPESSVRAEELQPLVKDVMNTLLVRCPTLLDETDKCNLMDRKYCKNSLDLRIGNFPLLRRVTDGRKVSGHARYYTDPYGEFYVCSQWGKGRHVNNARSLLRFVTQISEKKAGESNAAQLAKHKNLFRDYIDRNERKNLDHG